MDRFVFLTFDGLSRGAVYAAFAARIRLKVQGTDNGPEPAPSVPRAVRHPRSCRCQAASVLE